MRKFRTITVLFMTAAIISSCATAYNGSATASTANGIGVNMSKTETINGTQYTLDDNGCTAVITAEGATATVKAVKGVRKSECLVITAGGSRKALQWKGAQARVRLGGADGNDMRRAGSLAYTLSSMAGYYGGYNSGLSKTARDVATAANYGTQIAYKTQNSTSTSRNPKIIIASTNGKTYVIELRKY